MSSSSRLRRLSFAACVALMGAWSAAGCSHPDLPHGSGQGGSGPGAGGATGTGGATGAGGSSGGTNLITNGDFSQGDTNWHFENGTASVSNGQYCATTINASALFGWQDVGTPLALSAGQQYTLTYQASGSGGAALQVKVAHAVGTFMPVDLPQTASDSLSGSLQTFTHVFTPASADDNAGVAFFVISGSNICLANVTLIAN